MWKKYKNVQLIQGKTSTVSIQQKDKLIRHNNDSTEKIKMKLKKRANQRERN